MAMTPINSAIKMGKQNLRCFLGAKRPTDYDSTIYLMDLSLCVWGNCNSQVIEMHLSMVPIDNQTRPPNL